MNKEKEAQAIERLRIFEPAAEPYCLCYSGGKDSDCIRILADLAGVNYECHHNLTTVDAPETVRYVKEVMRNYGEEKYIRTEAEKYYQYGDRGFIHIPPLRQMRYCCSELKEGGKRPSEDNWRALEREQQSEGYKRHC